MATDVKLDQIDGTFLVLEGRVVKAVTSDFMLDSPVRRKGGGPFRRALVHDQNDGLTVNFNGDYPGGVTVAGVAQIIPLRQQGMSPIQPSTLVVRGDISFEMPGISGVFGLPGSGQGGTVMIPTSLNEQITSLQDQISKLSEKVAALLKK